MGLRRLAWGVWVLCAALSSMALGFLVANGGTQHANSLGRPVADAVFAVLFLTFPTVGAALSSREPLRWFALVALVGGVGLVAAFVASLLSGGWRDPVGVVAWGGFLLTILVGLPITVAVAVLRHRLFDIDLVIKRTLVYGSLTVLLVAAYLGVVLVARVVVSPVTSDSDLAVAASTLTVAALFGPLRARVQAVVDLRFYRSRYDASRTLDGFSMSLREGLDLDALGSDQRRVVRDTMQPAHVSLWVREDAR